MSSFQYFFTKSPSQYFFTKLLSLPNSIVQLYSDLQHNSITIQYKSHKLHSVPMYFFYLSFLVGIIYKLVTSTHTTTCRPHKYFFCAYNQFWGYNPRHVYNTESQSLIIVYVLSLSSLTVPISVVMLPLRTHTVNRYAILLLITKTRMFRASRTHMLLCQCWGEGVIVWEVARCYKKCFMLRRAKEEVIAWVVSEPTFVGICWNIDGNLFAIDAKANLYSVSVFFLLQLWI